MGCAFRRAAVVSPDLIFMLLRRSVGADVGTKPLTHPPERR